MVIANLQARTLERPLDDRPVQLEISVIVSEPQRVVGGTAALRRLRLPQETCGAPGDSPIVATTLITSANLEGDRLRVVLQPRLPAGRSRLCALVGLAESLPQKTRGSGLAETPVNQTNELDLVLDVFPGKGPSSPKSPSLPPPPPASPPKSGPPLPVVSVSAPDASAAESPSDTGTFRVSRTGSTSVPLTVSFSLGGSASAADYDPIGSSVVIPAGSATATITVTPVNDTDGENAETVVLILSSGAGYTVGSPSSAAVTITSEDQLVQGGGNTGTSGKEGNQPCPAGDIPLPSSCPVSCPSTFDGTVFQITLRRIGSTAADLPVFFTIGGGTASASFDFYFRLQVSAGGNVRTVTIAAGQTDVKVCVITVANGASEGDETVILSIQPNAAYTVGSPSSVTLTIEDDDGP